MTIAFIEKYKLPEWMSEGERALTPAERVRRFITTWRGLGLQKNCTYIPTTLDDYWDMTNRRKRFAYAHEVHPCARYESGGGLSDEEIDEIICEVVPELYAEYWDDLLRQERERREGEKTAA